MTRGHPKLESPSKQPARTGLAAPARLRGAAVTLAAAGRSDGVTTAMTYDVRAGTSIWERVLFISSSAIAISSVGAKGTSIKQTFDGRCVKTIVFTRPMRRASRTAIGYEKAERRPDQKNKEPAAVSDNPKWSNSHSASSDWTKKPPPNESRLNSAAKVNTIRRDGPSGPLAGSLTGASAGDFS